jgi:hypothetical protein
MDVFFFDMLCFWVLFEKYLFGITSLPSTAFWANELFVQSSDSFRSERVLEKLKDQRMLALLAKILLDAEVTIETQKKNALSQFFDSALSCESDKREASLRKLVAILTSHR